MRAALPFFRLAARTTAAVLFGSSVVAAQGSLSVQGFGFPSGQFSTRTLGTGGALADFDAQSPINPASIGSGLRSTVYVQYDPEFRTSVTAGRTSQVTVARFPIFMISAAYEKATFGLSYSNFLDRTWSNEYADTVVIGAERLPTRVKASSLGGIADIRGAFAWTFSPRFVVGIGLHAFSGNNTTVIGRTFDDSLRFGGFNQSGVVGYGGMGTSIGFVAVPFEHFNIAADARFGGSLNVRQGDSTVLGSANVPQRLGASFAYDGIPGSTFAVRWAKERWSDLKGLGSAGLGIQDATDISIGAEIAGPKLNGSDIGMRIGTRSRELPFAVRNAAVKETSYSGGLGIPVARNALVDLGLQHATRTATGANETAWIVSVGLSIRP
ncbi:MAG: hypothetical protein NTZ43_07170 [Gemmatimonadetes bacterium]|nr:hypothetical protein [Gemmatimonadota bacterium]